MWQNLDSLMPNPAMTSPGHALNVKWPNLENWGFTQKRTFWLIIFSITVINDYNNTDNDDDDAEDNDDDDDDDDDNDQSIKEVLWWIVTLQRKQWPAPI